MPTTPLPHEANRPPIRKIPLIAVIAYLVAFLALLAYFWSLQPRAMLFAWLAPYELVYQCVLIGGLGGTVYCLRAVYLTHCVRNVWDERWAVWYVLRPVVSTLMGGVAYIFLSAGLLVLDADHDSTAGRYGFFALSFIAGLNVDRFIVRIEEIAKSTWGIRPTRVSERSDAGRANVTEADDKKGTS